MRLNSLAFRLFAASALWTLIVLPLTGYVLHSINRQEVERVGQKLAAERGLSFRPIEDGQTIRGRLIGATQLASGRFAMIDDGFGFSLVPWRPVIEREIGREVMGVMRGHDVSWQLGRSRGLEI